MTPLPASLPVPSAWKGFSALCENAPVLLHFCSAVHHVHQLWSSGFNSTSFCSALCNTGLVLIHLLGCRGDLDAGLKPQPVQSPWRTKEADKTHACYISDSMGYWFLPTSMELLSQVIQYETVCYIMAEYDELKYTKIHVMPHFSNHTMQMKQ